jgi:hypothetical protein
MDHRLTRCDQGVDLGAETNWLLSAATIFFHGLPSVREARLGPPEQPSFFYRTKGRAAGLSPGS